MPRVFVHHDKGGKILSIAAVETLPEGLAHPFWLDDPGHGVIEASPDDPALADGLARTHETARVDVAAGKLLAPGTAAAPRAQRDRSSPA